MGNILLSICLPTYNRSMHIKRQLSFIMEEATFYLGTDIEVLVSNNASTDDTDQVTREIAAKYPGGFFYEVQRQNLGLIGNIKYLVQKASGKYVWVVGDDDILKPGLLGRLIGLLEQYQNEELGAIFLGSIFSIPRNRAELIDSTNGIVKWEDLELREGHFGLMHYGRKNAQAYLRDNPLADLIFITRCVVLREAWVKVVQTPECGNGMNLMLPLCASLTAVREKAFFVDKEVSIYSSIKEASWLGGAAEGCSVEMLQAFLYLQYLGFPESEWRPLASAFLSSDQTWTALFNPKFGIHPIVFLKFIWIISKNGFLSPFSKGFHRGFLRFLKKAAGK